MGRGPVSGASMSCLAHHSWRARLYLWLTRRLYAELAWAYDVVSWVVSAGQWSRWRRGALESLHGKRVLEIGFGTGELLLAMAGRGWSVVGLDPSPAMQRIASRKLRRRCLTVPRVRARAQGLPFVNGCFDTVVSTFPAEYILDLRTLVEAYRVLKPDGRVVISGLYYRLERERSRRPRMPGIAHPQADALATARVTAAEAGFRAIVVPQASIWRGWEASSPILILERAATRDDAS